MVVDSLRTLGEEDRVEVSLERVRMDLGMVLEHRELDIGCMLR